MIKIPLIEGEKLFSLIVLESLNQIKKFFEVKDELGLSDTTVYLNVSAPLCIVRFSQIC